MIATKRLDDRDRNRKDSYDSELLKPIILTLIPESWKQNPKRGTVTEGVFRKNIHRKALHEVV